MPKRCHAHNGRVLRATELPIDYPPPEELVTRRVWLEHRSGIVLLNLLSAVLLMVSFAPFNCWFLGFVAMVPWLCALDNPLRPKWSLLWATLAGTIFWAASLYWLTWVTLVGYFALLVVLSLYWLVAAIVLRSAMRRCWPMWIMLPLVWVTLEYARAYTLSGFPWFNLAQTMHSRTTLIQIADITGQYGVSFFIAMVSGLLGDIIAGPMFKRKKGEVKFRLSYKVGIATVILVFTGLWAYGRFRLSQNTTAPGPVIALVQQAHPISLHGRSDSPEDILESHLTLGRKLTGASIDLLVMPETMAPSGINKEFLTLDVSTLSDEHVNALTGTSAPGMSQRRRTLKRYIDMALWPQASKIGELSKNLDAPVVVGAIAMEPNPSPVDAGDLWFKRNAALWFDRSWQSTERYYSKMHLVPFSEYVPFKRSSPAVYKALRWFVPAVMEQLEPGDELRMNKVAVKERNDPTPPMTPRVVTPICYEGTFARICRKLVNQDNRKAQIIINMSNDGWFVRQRRDGSYTGSTEHAQHLAHYVFRAIENRTPVVRAVNTGVSASIDSNGRVRAHIHDDKGRQTMVSGVLLLDDHANESREGVMQGPRVLVDERLTLYSAIGDVFAMVVSMLACLSTAWLVAASRRTRQATKGQVKK